MGLPPKLLINLQHLIETRGFDRGVQNGAQIQAAIDGQCQQ